MCACVRSEGLLWYISPLLFSSLHFMYCHSLSPKISWLLLKLAEHGRSSVKTVCELNEDCIAWIFITLCNIVHEVLKYILVSKISWEAHFDVHAPCVTIKLNWLHPSTCSSVWILSYNPQIVLKTSTVTLFAALHFMHSWINWLGSKQIMFRKSLESTIHKWSGSLSWIEFTHKNVLHFTSLLVMHIYFFHIVNHFHRS